jgi:hypothetical protein
MLGALHFLSSPVSGNLLVRLPAPALGSAMKSSMIEGGKGGPEFVAVRVPVERHEPPSRCAIEGIAAFVGATRTERPAPFAREGAHDRSALVGAGS